METFQLGKNDEMGENHKVPGVFTRPVRCVATPGNANRQYNSINHTELNLVGKCENDMSAMASTQLLSLNLASYIHPSV